MNENPEISSENLKQEEKKMISYGGKCCATCKYYAYKEEYCMYRNCHCKEYDYCSMDEDAWS